MSTMTETFVQALCADCDGLHEFWRYGDGEDALYEHVHDYPVYPRCIFEASLHSSPSDPRKPLTDHGCDYCGGELVEIVK